VIAYLSGAMEHAHEEGAEWRSSLTKWLKEHLNHSVVDPVMETQRLVQLHDAHDYRNWKSTDPERFKAFVRKCIANDLNHILNTSDYVICLWNSSVKSGGGTQGEITMAYHNKIPVYLVNRISDEEMSGWIMGCSTEIFSNFKGLKQKLLDIYGKN
jgi:hypothetical protein